MAEAVTDRWVDQFLASPVGRRLLDVASLVKLLTRASALFEFTKRAERSERRRRASAAGDDACGSK